MSPTLSYLAGGSAEEWIDWPSILPHLVLLLDPRVGFPRRSAMLVASTRAQAGSHRRSTMSPPLPESSGRIHSLSTAQCILSTAPISFMCRASFPFLLWNGSAHRRVPSLAWAEQVNWPSPINHRAPKQLQEQLPLRRQAQFALNIALTSDRSVKNV